MSNYYLVARDIKTNDYNLIRGFDTLEQVDLYTTSSHNSKDLGKKIWRGGIIPNQELDFFIVKERSNKEAVKTMDVLYSDSKEIRNIALNKDSDSVDNLLQHFYQKLTTSKGFYDLVERSTNISKLYDTCLPTKDYIEIKTKDKNGNYVEYPAFRKMVEAFSRYQDKKKNKIDLNRVLLNRLILERSMLEKLNNNENQISVFELMDPIDYIDCETKYDDKLIEIMDFIDRLPEGFIYIKKGQAHISNNIYTMNEDLDKLDSLLDREFGYILNDYISNKNSLDKTIDKQEINELKQMIKNAKLRLIEILSSNQKVSNDTYRLMNIVSENQSKLLGDNYEYRRN